MVRFERRFLEPRNSRTPESGRIEPMELQNLSDTKGQFSWNVLQLEGQMGQFHEW